MRILIIEDSEFDFRLIERALDNQFSIAHEWTLSAGLAAATAGVFELIILDLSLPDSYGYDTFERAHAAVPQVPILILSGFNDEALALRAVSNGAQDFVQKARLLNFPLDRTVRYTIERRRFEEAARCAEREVRESERLALSTVDALTAHIAILDQSGAILAVNRAWRQFAAANGTNPDDVGIGKNYLELCGVAHGPSGDEACAAVDGIRVVIRGEQAQFTMEYPCDSSSEKRWFVLRVSRFSGDGTVRVVVAHENITERRVAEDRLRHDSLHDALTGLPNRALLSDRIGRCIERAKRRPDSHFAVLFLDLDRFKIINDSLGHAAGDRLLMAVTSRLSECVRGTDSVSRNDSNTVARLGGDEFIVLLEDLRKPEDAVLVADRVLLAVAQPVMFDEQEIFSTVSIGIVTHSGGNAQAEPLSANVLLRNADAAMYCAKSRGKNQHVIFDSSLHTSALEELRLESDLRRALERNEFLLHYQPIVSLETRQLSGFEALIRWRRDGQLIAPAQFIPVAEETGLIVPMGQWVLEESCRQLAAWRTAHPEFPNLYVSVNVSRRQLNGSTLVKQVTDVLRSNQIDPAHVRLEITESVIMESGDSARQTLNNLKATGVELSMDDFGTGYSSLSCLNKFPIDVLKIDRSFLADVPALYDTSAVLSAVMTLAHQLGMTVVAEGLEDLDHIALLQALGCDDGQGYIFSRPVSAAEAEQFFERSLLGTTAAA